MMKLPVIISNGATLGVSPDAITGKTLRKKLIRSIVSRGIQSIVFLVYYCLLIGIRMIFGSGKYFL